MESGKVITAEVRLDKKTFRGFAFYDTFVIKKRWIRPAVFFAIMTVSAAAALLIGKEQSGLLAGVLFAAGAGLPAVYVISFLDQVNTQAKKNLLSPERLVYTLVLDDRGLNVSNHQKADEKLELEWKDITAYYRKKCIYLYSGGKAFLLPCGQSDVSDSELKEYISSRISRSL